MSVILAGAAFGWLVSAVAGAWWMGVMAGAALYLFLAAAEEGEWWG